MSSSDTNFDALMVDWLYDELDPAEAKSFEEHLEAHPEARAEATALKQTRAAFQELDEAEPPSSLSAILMHEAAQAAEPKVGLWASFTALFQPIFMHPGVSAMATLVVVVGVAGALYSRKGDVAMEAQPVAVTAQPSADKAMGAPPPAAPAPETLAAKELEQTIEAEEVADEEAPEPDPSVGYQVGLAGDGAEGAIATAKDSFDKLEERKSDSKSLPGKLGRANTRKTAKGRSTRDFESDRSENKPSDIAFGTVDSSTNAISGARAFADAPAGGEAAPAEKAQSGKRSKSKPKVAKKKARPKSTAPANRRAQAGPAQAQQKQSWEDQKAATLAAAARDKRCRDAGIIANDILDKKPAYYKKKVAGTKAVKDCRSYVASETKRRAKVRSKRAARSKKAAGQPKKAKAAPRLDEANTAEGL
jgi:hypothetical protein